MGGMELRKGAKNEGRKEEGREKGKEKNRKIEKERRGKEGEKDGQVPNAHLLARFLHSCQLRETEGGRREGRGEERWEELQGERPGGTDREGERERARIG